MTRDAGSLVVYDEPADVAQALVKTFADAAEGAMAVRNRFSVALAGGATPKAAYRLLATPPAATAIDWNAIQFFFGDERCVPPDSDQSNYKTAFDAFLGPLGVPREHIHRMRGEDDPHLAAEKYREELTATFGPTARFDLVMLGMGADGHTASLFPGEDPTTENAALVRAVYSKSQSQWRITLTPAVLNAARAIVFTVEGAGKAQALKAVREGPVDHTRYPAQIIAPTSGKLTWLVDRAAAGQ